MRPPFRPAGIFFGRLAERRLYPLEQAHAYSRCCIILKRNGASVQSRARTWWEIALSRPASQ
jgi:hypothetical protein